MPRIAVIDDDDEILELMPRLLSGSAFDVDCVRSSEEFLTLLREGGHAAALVDFWLKSESALALLDRLAAEGPDLPVILMSGGGGGHSAEVAEALGHVSGVAAFLPKPFRRHELIATLDRCAR